MSEYPDSIYSEPGGPVQLIAQRICAIKRGGSTVPDVRDQRDAEDVIADLFQHGYEIKKMT